MIYALVFVSHSYYKTEKPLGVREAQYVLPESVTNGMIPTLITHYSFVNYSCDMRPAQSHGTLNEVKPGQ